MNWINKQIQQFDRRTVEEIITYTLYLKPWYRESFFFHDRDFSSPELWKIVSLILSAPQNKADLNYLIENGVELRTLLDLNTRQWADDMAILSTVAFGALANQLRDMMVKQELDNRMKMAKTSVEVLEYAKELSSLKSAYEVNSLQKVTSEFYDDYVNRQDKKKLGESTFVDTMVRKYDEHVHMERGDLLVLGARTSIGKTMFSLWIALQAARRGHKVLYVNLEMGRTQIMNRILGMISRKPISDYKYLHANIDEAMMRIDPYLKNFYIESGSSLTTDEIRSFVMSRNQLDFVVIDYINILGDKGEFEHQRLGGIANKLKQIALAGNCAVLCLAQLNRESEKLARAPELYDIRDSDVVANAADTVILLSKQDRKSQQILLNVPKSRNGLLPTDIAYDFDFRTSQYKEI